MITETQIDRLGIFADRIDNLIAAETLPIPEHTARNARTAVLAEIRDGIRALYTELTGVDEWQEEPA